MEEARKNELTQENETISFPTAEPLNGRAIEVHSHIVPTNSAYTPTAKVYDLSSQGFKLSLIVFVTISIE